MKLSEIYGHEYHKGIRDAYRGKVADRFYRAINSLGWRIDSIIDLGCSCGVFLEPFYKSGVSVCGVDGDETAFADDIRCIPRGNLHLHDLREPYYPPRKFDVCLCTETLEHIEPEYSDVIVDSICRCANRLFIIAAALGQGGVHHVNLRAIEEWQADFEKRGFKRRTRLPAEIRNWPTLLVMTKRK